MPTELPNERTLRAPGTMELDPSAEGVAIDETTRLIASNKVEGTAVYNRDGEHLGSVYNFMVDKISGQVAYAVMSFGGFLGLGDSYHPLPWKALRYDTELGGYVVDLDKERLAGAELPLRRGPLRRSGLPPEAYGLLRLSILGVSPRRSARNFEPKARLR